MEVPAPLGLGRMSAEGSGRLITRRPLMTLLGTQRTASECLRERILNELSK